MTVSDLRTHYHCKTDSDLAKVLEVTKGTISKWRSQGIPQRTQALLQIKTENKVKAHIQAA